MKTAALISILLLTPFLLRSQQAAPVVPAQVPSTPNGGNMPVGSAMSSTTTPTNQPDTNAAATNPLTMNTNQFGATNPEMASMTNNNPGMAGALELTNRLSVMAPAQVQSVIQVQVGLNGLQQVAVSLGGVQNLQQVIQQNPQVRQQLQLVTGQIIGLARGPVKPSRDAVDRISFDLLRACSRGRLTAEHELVLAVIINLTLNSQRLPATEIDSAVNNGLIVLQSAGVPPAFCNSFGCDLRSIALELQPNLGI